jgi:protein MBA1
MLHKRKPHPIPDERTGTFVTPHVLKTSAVFTRPTSFLRFQYHRLRCRLRDLASRLILKWASPKTKSFFRRTIKLENHKIAPAAQVLHAQMYKAFADGNSGALRKLCTDNVYQGFRARLGGRPHGETVVWELLKYNQPSKLVSDRAARFPTDGAAIRQAVVRICSQQRLTRYVRGKVVKGTGTARDVVEYVVLQRAYWKWKESEWKIWGTTKETKMEDTDNWSEKNE